ncbi:MAG TPA: CHASE3 domain-containing protein, partial [Chitinophagaceae bacterium]|nr:CHASE3 domain-containing protein [Chitinophagaceae bacterium]
IFTRTKTEKTIRNVYLVAFILLLLSYLFTLYTNKQLVKQAARVNHTNLVIKSLDNTFANIIDAETGVRGYILSKNIQFLFPYYGTEQRADSLYTVMQDLVQDNPPQYQRLASLKKFMDRRFGILRFHVKAFDTHNRQITDSMLLLQNEGKQLMDNIRENIRLMQRQEDRLLIERGDRLKQTTSAINAITIISITLAVSLLFFGLITYMQVSRERKKGLDEIDEYQSSLNDRILKLDEANAELIKMRSLEKFAATGRIARTIAHEIRNPLTNINLASEQLKDETAGKNENAIFLFDMISRNSNRINQLISDLLNSTKFTDLNYQRTPVNDFVEETLKEAQDRIDLNHISVIKRYTTAPCFISIDKIKMKIALLNIIINAIEAMDGREGSELMLGTRKEGNRCWITIGDNGNGMDKESLSRIFEPYFTSKPKGNGLGLTNTQNIVLNHSGEISVESTPGKGTNFIIILATVS